MDKLFHIRLYKHSHITHTIHPIKKQITNVIIMYKERNDFSCSLISVACKVLFWREEKKAKHHTDLQCEI